MEFDSAGTICQTVATIGGISAAGGFLLARRANYRPLPFNVIVEQMEKEVRRPCDQAIFPNPFSRSFVHSLIYVTRRLRSSFNLVPQ